jgi:hypothetical protein
MEKVGENGRRVKAIALLFGQFSTFFQKWKKLLKMDRQLRLQPYFLAIFDLFSKMEKVDENGRKVKAIGAGPPVFIQLSAPLFKIARNLF